MALQEEFESQGIWLFRYRGSLPIIILIIAIYFYIQSQLNPTLNCFQSAEAVSYFEYFCLAISLLGLYIRSYTVGHTPNNTSGRNVTEQVADTVNTTGIYSTLRHPLYLGNFFMWLGPALLTQNWWFNIAFGFFYWVYYERIMFAEEQFLRKKFGALYTDWAAKTPAFIPSFAKFVKPNLPFSWKKVIKKEKNGLAATFLIFALFNIAGNYVQHKTTYNGFFITAAVLSSLLYIILKYIKSNTNILNEEGR
jgi:protein-S-isoprenylcysteine O-methyltransferase Ste14